MEMDPQFAAFISTLPLSPASTTLLTTALASSKSNTSTGLLLLTHLFPTTTHSPGTTSYTAIQSSHWSLRAPLPAALVFTPLTTADISTALKVLSHFRIPFSIRSGGHAPFPGSSSTNGGVLISLEKFSTIQVSKDRKTVFVGAGVRWGEVYGYLAPLGLCVVGGRVPVVGVGGLLLGGGIALDSGRYGMACDMVESFEVVLARGEVVVASRGENEGLFKALKGGGNNFGIVTRFELYTVPMSGVWGGLVSYEPRQYGECLAAIVEYQTTHQPVDPHSGMVAVFLFADSGKQQGFANLLFHDEVEDPVSLRRWKEIGPVVDATKRTTLGEMIDETYFGYPALNAEMRRDFRTLSIGVDLELYRDIVALFTSTYTAIADTPGLQVILSFQPMAASTVAAGREKGGNVLGIKEEAQMWFVLTTGWSDAADDKVAIGAGVKFFDTIARMAREKGLLLDFLYMNDAGMDQRVVESYGEENIRFLKMVAGEVDPEGVFQRLVKEGFKLS
ncbi:FAD-binding domain-containing protein [Wilcoxina mikolae CBS 423.85]|nr:FAD-binding domain-containing protein [Wilcoxina mikolae CBS 423.85]